MSSGLATKRDFQVGLEMAWHGQTVVVDKVTREHFPEISMTELYYGENQTPLMIGDKPYFVAMSHDDGLPVGKPFCPDTYTLHTPREGLEWAEEILKGSGYEIQSLGMLWDRSKWFATVYLKELQAAYEGKENHTKFFFNFSGSLDGTMIFQAELSAIRQVCHNTVSLSRAMGEVLFKKKATKNFAKMREEASADIEKAVGMTKVFNATMERLGNQPIKLESARNVYAGMLAKQRNLEEPTKQLRRETDELQTLFLDGMGNHGETKLDLLNGWTEYHTHGSQSGKVDKAKNWASSEFGGRVDQKAEFVSILMNPGNRLAKLEDSGSSILAMPDRERKSKGEMVLN